MPRSQPPISRRSARTANGRRARRVIDVVVGDLERMRLDAGATISAVARAAGVSQPHLSQILAGRREPSISVLVAVSTALGSDLSVRSYPRAGPRLRDAVQAPIVEELCRIADPRWRRSVEVQVHRPARGFIDVVFDDLAQPVIVATEVQSRVDRLEQQLRWSADKAASLPSSDLWAFIPGQPSVSRLLVLRSTVPTRDLARRFSATLAASYPAPTIDVYRSLTGHDAPWPGAGILWATVTGDSVRILERPPRGVELGR